MLETYHDEEEAEHTDGVQELHGSGTTNPSKLIWKVLDLMEERTRIPLHGTYRAIGSGGGISEFVARANNFASMNHFGAGDIAIGTEDYDDATAAGRTFIHVPFVLGAISVFHSVPLDSGMEEVKLDGCTLAKIFQRNITKWDDGGNIICDIITGTVLLQRPPSLWFLPFVCFMTLDRLIFF